ncbi:membrane protein insertase YidC [Nostocoides veronense]|uniref:Membrane protein insertase YidC n=1 Tax=Nostocoides veronense TaxID=330836 RepID=A0ABN2M4W1_9MICO
MGDFFNSVLYPIEWVVAWIMYGFHQFFSAIGMPEASGWTWGLSFVGLVIVMRAALIPLFVKQINASRKMQMISPEIQKIQAKYKGKTDPESRQKMTQETMELYRTTGTNPFSSCLPILAQSPIFFGLFRVLNGLESIARGDRDAIGPITKDVASQAEQAMLFGAQLSDRFIGADTLNTKIVTIVLIVLMSVTTFTTQRQLMTKNMPASALDNPFARQQKVLLYVLPLVFAISGVNFPIGVLIYWFVTNVWSMGQQFYVIRRNPTPGSLAEKALHERRARKGKPITPGAAVAGGGAIVEDEAPKAPGSGQRQQPKRKDRQRKPQTPPKGPNSPKPPKTEGEVGTAGPQDAPGKN